MISGAENWVAAGVFIPARQYSRTWAAAMDELEAIAGRDYLDAATGVGATA